jgi:hypothetical protein
MVGEGGLRGLLTHSPHINVLDAKKSGSLLVIEIHLL